MLLFLQDAYYSVLQVCKVYFVYRLQHLKYHTAFLTGCPPWCCRVHGACDVLAMCGKFNGDALCMVCDVH